MNICSINDINRYIVLLMDWHDDSLMRGRSNSSSQWHSRNRTMEVLHTGQVEQTMMETHQCTNMTVTGADQIRGVAERLLKTGAYTAAATVEVTIPPASIRILDLPSKGTMTTMICGDVFVERMVLRLC